MKKVLMLFVGLAFLSGAAVAADTKTVVAKTETKTMWKWDNETAVTAHLTTHVTYPATAATIIATCKKEMPKELTEKDWKRIDLLPEAMTANKMYPSASAVIEALAKVKM